MQVINVTTWNQPRISVLREDSYPGWEGTDDTIQEGDILHIDFGITAMGMNTDTQHMAYVLRTSGSDAEDDAPESLRAGLKQSNRMQDIVLGNMRPGISGNTVLRKSLNQMARENIKGQIFSHPIGDWGHDAGTVIGKFFVVTLVTPSFFLFYVHIIIFGIFACNRLNLLLFRSCFASAWSSRIDPKR